MPLLTDAEGRALKTCAKCGETKQLGEFYRRVGSADGHTDRCKNCARAYAQQYHKQNRERQNAKSQKWHRENPEQAAATLRRCQLARYGLTLEQYAVLLVGQHGVCAICEQPETQMFRGKVYPLSVDHNHQTGKIRGLLCQACNSGLGYFRDSPERLSAAVIYLEKGPD